MQAHIEKKGGTLNPEVRIAIVCNVIMFFLYGWIGSIYENVSYLLSEKCKIVNSVVMTGFPLYSIGGLTMVGLNRLMSPKLRKNIPIQFLVYGTVATLLELVTGLVVGAGAGAKMSNGHVLTWDYSNLPFNYRGIISLKHFVIWGVVGLGAVSLYNTLYPYIRKAVAALADDDKNKIKN